MAQTQLLINTLLSGEPSRLRVYGAHQPAPRDMFTDLKTLARVVSIRLVGAAADPSLRSDIAGLIGPDHTSSAQGTVQRTIPSASQIANACTTAAAVLDAPDPAAAQRMLAQINLAATNTRPHRVYNNEAVTPFVRLICQGASEDARATLKLRRRFDATAAKSAQSRSENRLSGAATAIDFSSHQSGTRWCR